MLARRMARGYRHNILAGLSVCVVGLAFAAGLLFGAIGPAIARATPYSIATSVFDGPADPPILVGHVTWQGISQPNSANSTMLITLTLKMDSVEVNYPAQYTDASGFFTADVSSLVAGMYQWRVKSRDYYQPQYSKNLANSGTVTLSGEPTTNVEMGLMKAGDIINDNVVNNRDFNVLRGLPQVS